jgi:internalin A
MRKVIVFLLVVLSANAVLAEDPVYFADPNLKAAVEERLGIIDPTPTDMRGLTFLDASEKGIIYLTGIETATNLTELRLRNNQISDTSAVSGLTNLTYLSLVSNQISDISTVSGLTNLTYLRLSNNQISNISPVSGLTNLTYLELGNNQISNISPISSLTNLAHLWLQGNQISDISPVSGLTNLAHLDLSNNQISDTSAVSGLTNLIYLHLHRNQISDISAVSGLTNLKRLTLERNLISDISPVSGLTNLTYLTLDSNQISDISPISDLTNLTVLSLSHNQIGDIFTVSGLTNLTSLNLYNNQISNISPVSGLTSLTYLRLRSNQISDIAALSSLYNLNYLYLSDNPLNCPSYDTYLPLIETNNPGIYITYDPRPEYCDPYIVSVDIKPAACPNPLSVYSYGILQVAILGTEEFDVNEIDVVSVRLNDVAPIRHNYEDVSTPVLDANDCNCTAEGADGYLDVILKFETEDITNTLPDVNNGDVVELPITGVLTDATPIEGSDCIVIQGSHKPMNRGDINQDGVVNMVDLAIVSDNWLEE